MCYYTYYCVTYDTHSDCGLGVLLPLDLMRQGEEGRVDRGARLRAQRPAGSGRVPHAIGARPALTLADTSKNGMPRLSANSLPCIWDTCRLWARSSLLPTCRRSRVAGASEGPTNAKGDAGEGQEPDR